MNIDLDKKIYNEYLNGKKESFEILYSKYKNKIKYFIFNIIKDYDKAEDITQDVFIYIMQNKFKDEYSFKYYIYLIAKSKALSYLDMENRRSEITKKYLLDKNSNSEEDSLEIITKEENKKELLDAINKLDNKYRNAMYLVKIEGLSYKQTAEILGQTVQNIKNLIHRGKKELRKTLIKKGFVEMNKVSKVLLIVLCSGILLSGVVFAKEIKNFVNELITNIFGTYNEGISTAIENDYNQKIDMEYAKSNNIKLKIDDILLDDYNFGFITNIQIGQRYLNKFDISKIEFRDFLVLDENNNLLFAKYDNEDEFNNYCEKNNLDKGIFGSGFSKGGYTSKILSKDNNNFITSFSTISEKFPNSQKISVHINKIYLLNNTAHLIDKVYRLTTNGFVEASKNDFIVINGDWNLDVNLEEMQKLRKTIEYSVVEINDDKSIITKANLSMSNMQLELITNSTKIDFEKLQNRDINRINVNEMIPFHDIYLETSSGKRFRQANSGSNGYDTIADGKIKYYTTFDYTYFDMEENVKIVLKTNKNEEIQINLQKI